LNKSLEISKVVYLDWVLNIIKADTYTTLEYSS
jgi:hypothetical protein